jgi:hypothetical protein
VRARSRAGDDSVRMDAAPDLSQFNDLKDHRAAVAHAQDELRRALHGGLRCDR